MGSVHERVTPGIGTWLAQGEDHQHRGKQITDPSMRLTMMRGLSGSDDSAEGWTCDVVRRARSLSAVNQLPQS